MQKSRMHLVLTHPRVQPTLGPKIESLLRQNTSRIFVHMSYEAPSLLLDVDERIVVANHTLIRHPWGILLKEPLASLREFDFRFHDLSLAINGPFIDAIRNRASTGTMALESHGSDLVSLLRSS